MRRGCVRCLKRVGVLKDFPMDAPYGYPSLDIVNVSGMITSSHLSLVISGVRKLIHQCFTPVNTP